MAPNEAVRWRVLIGTTMILMRASGFMAGVSRIPDGARLSRLRRLALSISDNIAVEAEAEMSKIREHFDGRSDSPLLWHSKEDASSFVQKNIDAILFDCDGVLYRTPDPIPGAAECLRNLMAANKKVLFVTNNAGVSREQLRIKLSDTLGIDGLTEDQMISSSYAAAQYLNAAFESNKCANQRVHVIGSSGLCQELQNYGFNVSGGPSLDKAEMTRQELAEYPFFEDPIDAVVVGHDVDFTFRKLAIANNLMLRNPEAIFVATNRDSFDLVGADGRHIPGNGCVVAALEHCSGRSAINVGKPSPELLNVIMQDHALDVGRTLFVGDRLDTDIKFGVDTGMITALVMTGVTSAKTISGLAKGESGEALPHAILSHVGKLL
jgi:4-nitrophenyl phosphatase